MLWAKIWFRDLLGHTSTLETDAFGAYVRLLMEYLDRQGPLPDDDRILRRIARVSPRAWGGIRDQLTDVYFVQDGFLHDQYADGLIRQFRELSAKNQRNAKQRYQLVTGGLQDADP
jgi:uncharacterized protein YdaU (DUF1376 family)